MSSGTDIIHRALGELGAHSQAAPALPASVALGRDVLNSMLQMWESRDIMLGTVPLKDTADELSEPLDATNGIVKNLSLKLAPYFDNGKTRVSRELVVEARNGFIEIKRLYRVAHKPQKIVSSTLPRGAGNRRGTRARIFTRLGQAIEN